MKKLAAYLAFVITMLLLFGGCKKKLTSPDNTGGGSNNPPPSSDSVYNPIDPPMPATVGFFQNAWKAKSFTFPAVMNGILPTGTVTDSLTINVNKVLVKVQPYVYGNNSNLWTGQMVTQPSLMQYLTDLSPNIIRGPGGSISDVYFWNGTDANPGQQMHLQTC